MNLGKDAKRNMNEMKKDRALTCIICPRGCALTVKFDTDGSVSEVLGNICARGKNYAVTECTAPMRTVTSTVRCEDGAVVPVKTNRPVPKGEVFTVMEMINSVKAPCKLHIGDVIISNVCGTGADVVATAEKH